ncbi:hypothetical protein H6P81_007040 [Aristolochia fimbriata]|uniref:Pectinesterase n=1 Tax=Aristolochia fimbriata TaxID=158543 RepID=A0AAV7F1S6_ARIFI|nr:hypothetical protein H6P81_007040 [Aristolochia fimbriata]
MASSLDQPFLAKPSSSPVRRTTLGVLILPVAASLLFLAAFAAFCAAIPNININNPFAICAHAPSPTTYSCVALVSREILIDSGINLPLTQTQRLQLLLLKSLPAVATSTEKARRRSLAPGVVSIRRQRMGLSDCVQLLNLSRDQLVDSLVVLIRSPELSKRAHSDVHTWLSAVLTNYVTCLDGLRGEAKSAMEARVEHLMDLATASLAMVVSLSPPGLPDAEDVLRQPLVKYHYPSWVTSADRNLLESSATEMKPHAVVSKDGKGDSTTVQGAIDAAPSRSKTRYVIRVKAGTYKEVVRINQDKENIMLNYSRTVFMQSKIESHINPLGWYPWNEDKGLDTLYYGEFRNFGPGSKTGKRVKWPGYHVITDTDVAMDFTVKEVIQGGDWLPSTGVPFEEGLGRP